MPTKFFQENSNRVLELQNFLSKNQYFSKDCLPGIADALMFQIFDKQFPNRQIYPYLYYWYVNIKQFSSDAIFNWNTRSQKDYFFLNILKQYNSREQEGQKRSSGKADYVDDFNLHSYNNLSEKETYIMQIRLKKYDTKSMNAYKKSMMDKKINIISIEQIGNQIRIKINCDIIKLELLKGQMNRCKHVLCCQVKKDKKVKFCRAQTFQQQ